MADSKISALPAASSATPTDEVATNQGGVTKKLTVAQLGAAISGTPGGANKDVQYNNAGAFGGITPAAAGTVLTSGGAGVTPSFQAPTGGSGGGGGGASGALVMLAELIAVNSASLDFTTRNALGQSGAIFQSDYDEYQFEFINLLPATNNVAFTVEYSADGGATWIVTGYRYSRSYFGSTSDGGSSGNNGAASIMLIDGVTNVLANGGYSGRFAITNPLSSTFYKQGWGDSATRNNNSFYYKQSVAGWLESTTPMTAIRFRFSTGNITQGALRCYGIAKVGSASSSGGAGSGALVLLEERVAIAAASLNFTSRNAPGQTGLSIQNDYDEYAIEIVGLVSANSGTSLLLRASADGLTFDAGANYSHAQYGYGAGGPGGNNASGATSMSIFGYANINNTVTRTLNAMLRIYNPQSTTTWKTVGGQMSQWDTGGSVVTATLSGSYNVLTQMNAFQLFLSSGTINAGVVRLYGVAKTTSPSASSTSAPRGGWELLNSTAAVNSATVELATRNVGALSGALFQSDYDQYYIELGNVVPATNATDLRVRMGTGTGPTWDAGAVYQWSGAQWNDAAGGASIGGNAVTFIKIGDSLSNAPPQAYNTSLRLSNPASAVTYKYLQGLITQNNSVNSFNIGPFGGRYGSATPVTGLQFYVATGNLTSGTFRVYGLNKTGSSAGAGPAPRAVGFVIGDGVAAITAGIKGYFSVPFTGVITGVTLLSTDAAATPGSIVVDLWKVPYASYPPTGANSITASAKPTLSSANKSIDMNLVGWTTTVSAGDILGVSVSSAAVVTRVGLTLSLTA